MYALSTGAGEVIQGAQILSQVQNLSALGALATSLSAQVSLGGVAGRLLAPPILEKIVDKMADAVLNDAKTIFDYEAAEQALQCAGAPGN